MLSFDVEEYFQVEAAAGRIRPEQWDGIASRLAPCVDRILDLLAAAGARGTFFVLGWLARRQPGLIARIAHAGHEIASHGMNHQMVGRMTPRQFRRDVLESRKVLADITGRQVLGYRAPTFSITNATAWALDILAEEAFAYDSSVFPVRHDRYGVPGAPRWPHQAEGPGGGRILEIPPLTARWLGRNLPIGGGGYLRLLPVRLLGRALRAAGRRGRAGMIYLHPWELDPDQPALPMAATARWRHRVGLKRTEGKLRWLLDRFRFTGAAECIDSAPMRPQERFQYGLTGQ